MDTLQNILLAYPGDDEVFIQNKDDNKLYPLTELHTSVNPIMLNELVGLLGEKNVKVRG